MLNFYINIKYKKILNFVNTSTQILSILILKINIKVLYQNQIK